MTTTRRKYPRRSSRPGERHRVEGRNGKSQVRLIGQHHPKAKLTDNDVEVIRELHDEGGIGYKQIAEKFEVSKSCIAAICTYRTRARG